jgi:hypothetical protein
MMSLGFSESGHENLRLALPLQLTAGVEVMDPGSLFLSCALCMPESMVVPSSSKRMMTKTTGPPVLRGRTGDCRSGIHDANYQTTTRKGV